MFAISLISSQDSPSLNEWNLNKITSALETLASFVESNTFNEIDFRLLNE